MNTISSLDPQMIMLIDQWLEKETSAYLDLHHHYPMGRQYEDVIDNVYPKLQSAGINISYGELYDHYLATKNETNRKT